MVTPGGGECSSFTVMLVSDALLPIVLNCTPRNSAVSPLIVRFRPIVLPLIDHGAPLVPPTIGTFPLRGAPLRRTRAAFVAVMSPLTVMTLRFGSSIHGTPANLPLASEA